MRAKEYLQQIYKIDKMISNKIQEKEKWFEIATNTTAKSDGERVQSSGSQQKMADAVCKMVEINEEIDRYIDTLIDTKMDIIHTIEQLDSIEYDVLHKMYIQGKNLDDISHDYNKTYSWTTTVHGNALKDLQKILDGNEKAWQD